MKYKEVIVLGFIIILQWILLLIIFKLFWVIVSLRIVNDRLTDQLVKLITGGSAIGLWLFEWYKLLTISYKRISRCNSTSQ